MNYINLPVDIESAIKKVDIDSIIPPKQGHKITRVNTQDFLTNDTLKWFYSRKFFLKPTGFLFRMSENDAGPIHVDSEDEYAFNFILRGLGEMQWVSNIVSESTKVYNVSNAAYLAYEDVKSFDIIDSWTGNVGLVKVNTPHRIVTGDSVRFCFSVRVYNNIHRKTFDEAYKLIYNETQTL